MTGLIGFLATASLMFQIQLAIGEKAHCVPIAPVITENGIRMGFFCTVPFPPTKGKTKDEKSRRAIRPWIPYLDIIKRGD